MSPKHHAIPKPASLAPSQRFLALDLHRGLIMILMAIDHAGYFVARVHAQEFWGMALPVYPDALWFWTRWVTHPCAPGFFFLMGTGLTLFADARQKLGWTEGQITGFFVVRGILLIILQLCIENPIWAFGDLLAEPGTMVLRGGPAPGGGTGSIIYLGVLFALGGTMVFWASIRRASPWLIALISIAAVTITQVVMSGPAHTGVLYAPLIRALLIPGHTGFLVVFYPVIPWLGVTGLGLLFGKLLARDPDLAWRAAGWAGLGFFILFVCVRTLGGFGNLNEVPAGWMGYLNVVKYPPSLAFLAVTLSLNLIVMSAWRWIIPWLVGPYSPLLLFGQAALFFYLTHLCVYALLGSLFRSGSGLAAMYAVWLLGLLILYPLCYWYNGHKHHKPPASLWRFF